MGNITSAQKLAALARIAGMKRDADLASLSAASARLTEAEDSLGRLRSALDGEIRKAVADPEVPVLQALDQHIILSERSRAALETRIATLNAERDRTRAAAAKSFGRALVLATLGDRHRKAAHKTDG